MSLARSIRSVLRRDVLLICAVIFCADLVSGIVSPTFSLYAKGLGASLTLIGVLSSTVGLTQLLTSMPIGLQSDKVGRKPVLVLGMLAFAAATAVFALSPSPWLLFPGRILSGLAAVSTFSIGAAYVGDIIRPEERGIAFGLYASSMGLGFAVGPLIGAAVASWGGIPASYLTASALGVLGASIAAWGLKDTRLVRPGVRSQRVGPAWGNMRLLLRNPALLAGSVGNMLTSITFGGMISNFFPLYVAQLGGTQAAINSMFSARAFGSTAARLPTGVLSSRLTGWLTITLALTLVLGVILAMSTTVSLAWLGVLLVIEGIGYGAFLTAGQAFVAEHSTPATRGTAIGVYSTAGSIGSTLSPILLGAVADILGVRAVILTTALLTALGLATIGLLYVRNRRVSEPAAA